MERSLAPRAHPRQAGLPVCAKLHELEGCDPLTAAHSRAVFSFPESIAWPKEARVFTKVARPAFSL